MLSRRGFVLAVVFAAALFAASKPVDLSLTDLQGGRVRVRDSRGAIVLLNFWATWCQPCNDEMPMLVSAAKEYGPKGVVFIGASLDEQKTVSRIPAFLQKYGVSFAVWTGATGDDLAKLKLGEAVPATAFIDRDGVVVARVSGQLREAELKERLDWLLSDRKGAAPAPFVSHLEK